MALTRLFFDILQREWDEWAGEARMARLLQGAPARQEAEG
jgi:hypothetical protein